MSDAIGSVLPVMVATVHLSSSGFGTNAIDMRNYYVSPGKREVLFTQNLTCVSASFTAALGKIYESTSSATTGCSVLSGACFDDAGGASFEAPVLSVQTCYGSLSPDKPWIRYYLTITGGSAVAAVNVFLVKRTS